MPESRSAWPDRGPRRPNRIKLYRFHHHRDLELQWRWNARRRNSAACGERPPSAFFFFSFLTFFVAAIILPSILLCRQDPSFSFLATSRVGELRIEASPPSRRGSSAMGKSISGEQTAKKDWWANEEVSRHQAAAKPSLAPWRRSIWAFPTSLAKDPSLH